MTAISRRSFGKRLMGGLAMFGLAPNLPEAAEPIKAPVKPDPPLRAIPSPPDSSATFDGDLEIMEFADSGLMLMNHGDNNIIIGRVEQPLLKLLPGEHAWITGMKSSQVLWRYEA